LALRRYVALQVGETQPCRWFSSAILRLVGVGLPIDFMQSWQVETVIPLDKVLRTKPGRGELGIMAFLSILLLSIIQAS
jgi:hypothetical protein